MHATRKMSIRPNSCEGWRAKCYRYIIFFLTHVCSFYKRGGPRQATNNLTRMRPPAHFPHLFFLFIYVFRVLSYYRSRFFFLYEGSFEKERSKEGSATKKESPVFFCVRTHRGMVMPTSPRRLMLLSLYE